MKKQINIQYFSALVIILIIPLLFSSCSGSVMIKKKQVTIDDTVVDFHNDFDEIRDRLVSEKCRKKSDKKKCKTFLHYLAASGNLDVLRKLDLRSEKYNINAADRIGNTPLHYAIMNNQFATSEFLIKNGADCNIKNTRGRTPLHLLVLFLPSAGYSIPTNAPNKGDVSSPYGIRKGPFTKLYEFHYGLDIAAPVGTPIRATAAGRVIKVGWNKGLGKIVRINHYNGFETIYAHCNSVTAKYYSKVRKGQVIATVGSTGYSTGSHCHYAIIYRGQSINPYPFTVHKYARNKIIKKASAIIEIAVSHKADINKRDNSGRTPLHYAAGKNYTITRKLLLQKAYINSRDYFGMTPLHFAASTSIPIAALLLRSGAYVNAKTRRKFKYSRGRYLRRGTTPLGIAIRSQSLAMAKLISRYGGKE